MPIVWSVHLFTALGLSVLHCTSISIVTVYNYRRALESSPYLITLSPFSFFHHCSIIPSFHLSIFPSFHRSIIPTFITPHHNHHSTQPILTITITITIINYSYNCPLRLSHQADPSRYCISLESPCTRPPGLSPLQLLLYPFCSRCYKYCITRSLCYRKLVLLLFVVYHCS